MKRIAIIILLTFIFLQCIAPGYKILSIIKTKEECFQLTWTNIDWWLNYYKVENIPVVMAQIMLETGNLTSKCCKENNNLFGMKRAKQRQSTAIKELNGMAYYHHWTKSIEDYVLWQKCYYKGEDYYHFLIRCGYATDSLYISKLKRIKETMTY